MPETSQDPQKQPPTPPEPPASASPGTATTVTLIITNATKLVGLVIAINEGLIRAGDVRPIKIALAAFMLAGAQGAEQFFKSFFGK